MLTTSRLRLVPIDSKSVEAYSQGRESLGHYLGASVPDSFPVFPESMEYWRSPGAPKPESLQGWGGYYLVHLDDAVVVGEGGYKGKPDANGHVELGYAIIPEYRMQGLASEAARALVHHAFSDPIVKSVGAHTLLSGGESIAVLKKLGFEKLRELNDPQDGAIVEWRLLRSTPNQDLG